MPRPVEKKGRGIGREKSGGTGQETERETKEKGEGLSLGAAVRERCLWPSLVAEMCRKH